MKYQIIKDEIRLQEFINWLPDLLPNECFYICLFARNKYTRLPDGTNKFPHIRTDKSQLKRFTCTKEDMIYKIKQLEIEQGLYKHKNINIPQESLAIYITYNPRSQIKAAKSLLKRFADLITQDYSNYNVHAEVMSELHKAQSRKIFIDFDFDDFIYKEDNFKFLNRDSYHVLKTRGGFHILVEINKIDKQYEKTWYNQMIKLNPDNSNPNMIPIPGCLQGNFTPFFYK